ncbi:MAG: peptidoglycan editing factor PgeF [Candidatus Anaerobiospirillum merdipullorum]|uniref:Purine nucleoside phosphorylase n=1 Tax=Candidatus Anaerobiospirillum merdipullorum TaxID=2838450 RepID=A0A9E2KNV8_9GAMM|nr:peptidoglycan editing factor PgeF [Candidatus Anaerobiospirillum merdipullorum]
MLECKPGLVRINAFNAPVEAYQTTRHGGESEGAYASFNLGLHTGDNAAVVAKNRQRLTLLLNTPWVKFMQQVHGAKVVTLTDQAAEVGECDAVVTALDDVALCVQTADCLPLLLADEKGVAIGAVHCGWRSLQAGIIAPAIQALKDLGAGEIIAWMGPAIGPQSFEVGPEVREAFVSVDERAKRCFIPGKGDRYLADLYALARLQLIAAGVRLLNAMCYDTFKEDDLFYSYRRAGVTGRMGSLILKRAGV